MPKPKTKLGQRIRKRGDAYLTAWSDGVRSMRGLRVLLASIMLGILTGCVGPLVPVVKFDTLSPEERHATLSMPIYNESQLTGRNYSISNVVEGISCKNKTWDPAATKSDAINQAKYWARQQGAEAIMNVQCEVPRGTTTSYNCWESITCIAQAIKLNH